MCVEPGDASGCAPARGDINAPIGHSGVLRPPPQLPKVIAGHVDVLYESDSQLFRGCVPQVVDWLKAWRECGLSVAMKFKIFANDLDRYYEAPNIREKKADDFALSRTTTYMRIMYLVDYKENKMIIGKGESIPPIKVIWATLKSGSLAEAPRYRRLCRHHRRTPPPATAANGVLVCVRVHTRALALSHACAHATHARTRASPPHVCVCGGMAGAADTPCGDGAMCRPVQGGTRHYRPTWGDVKDRNKPSIQTETIRTTPSKDGVGCSML